MFVACSTLCFAREPLETAFRQIAELEFDKFELAIVEDGNHLRPSEAGDNPEAALHRLRRGPSLIPSSLYIDFGQVDWADPVTRKRFDGLCRLAKMLSVAVITIHAAPAGTPIADEVKRLTPLVNATMREGLVLALLTHVDTLTADPATAVELCQLLPGLGLTVDPSHFLQGPNPKSITTRFFPTSRTSICAIRALCRASFRSASARARSIMPVSSICSSAMATTARSPSRSSTSPTTHSIAKSSCASSSCCSRRSSSRGHPAAEPTNSSRGSDVSRSTTLAIRPIPCD